MGQIERLPPPGLSARYVIRQETSAGAHGKGRNAPIAADDPNDSCQSMSTVSRGSVSAGVQGAGFA